MSGLREQLEEIRVSRGALTPEVLVAAARPPDHPLHSRIFDRPPGEAAEAWYQHQAHELIRSVRISFTDVSDRAPRSIRAFVAMPTTDAGAYVYEPTEQVVADPLKRAILMRTMERDWRTFKRRWEDFEEFSALLLADLCPPDDLESPPATAARPLQPASIA